MDGAQVVVEVEAAAGDLQRARRMAQDALQAEHVAANRIAGQTLGDRLVLSASSSPIIRHAGDIEATPITLSRTADEIVPPPPEREPSGRPVAPSAYRRGVRPTLKEVAPGVFHVEGPDTNWQLLAEAGEATLVDTGWPRDFPLISASLADVGLSGADVAAIILTHAHRDHLGSAGRFQDMYQTPVHAHAAEAAHVRGEVVEEASALALLVRMWRPGVIRFVSSLVARGGLAATRLDEIATFGEAVALDVPGRPIPIAAPGHTSGHCAFHLPHRGVLLAGDACATFDVLKRKPMVGLMPSIFDHDAAQAAESLRRLASVQASTVLPGHGPPFVGTPAQLVEQALGPRP